MIAAAGNPPRYNQSARSFDMATLDRVRRIDLEPSLAVWQEYAAAHAVHPAVLAYLRLHPEHFFVCDAQRSAGNAEGLVLQHLQNRGHERLRDTVDLVEKQNPSGSAGVSAIASGALFCLRCAAFGGQLRDRARVGGPVCAAADL